MAVASDVLPTAFQFANADKTEIELIETAELPVVTIAGRVVEEIRVGKVMTERTEEVQGTVRHTEVTTELVGSSSEPAH